VAICLYFAVARMADVMVLTGVRRLSGISTERELKDAIAIALPLGWR
jgi:hypothetical protein